MVQIATDILDGRYKPKNPLGHGPDEFVRSVGNAFIGLFASLMDRHAEALNVFDVWVALFPEREKRIIETWETMEPHVELVRKYRNDVACHVNKDPRTYLSTRQEFHERRGEVVGAVIAFSKLAAELMRRPHSRNSSGRQTRS